MQCPFCVILIKKSAAKSFGPDRHSKEAAWSFLTFNKTKTTSLSFQQIWDSAFKTRIYLSFNQYLSLTFHRNVLTVPVKRFQRLPFFSSPPPFMDGDNLFT